MTAISDYSKTCLKPQIKKKTKIDFQDRLMLNACQKYCRMLQRKHSAILLTFIKLLYHLTLISLFCLFLSGHLRQVLLFTLNLRVLGNFFVIFVVCCSILFFFKNSFRNTIKSQTAWIQIRPDRMWGLDLSTNCLFV